MSHLTRLFRVAGAAVVLASPCWTACDQNPTLPIGAQDPATYKTEAGAIAQYRGTLLLTQTAFFQTMLSSGLLTDEFHAASPGSYGTFTAEILVDSRTLDSPQSSGTGTVAPLTDNAFSALNQARGSALLAAGALGAYAPDLPTSLRAEMYADRAYTEILLADLFCSGVPLSTLDFEGDITLQPGSTTAQVYQHALAALDTALPLAADSARILNLVQVLRGRAFLALAQYDSADAAIAGVPIGFTYQLTPAFSGFVPSIQSTPTLPVLGAEFVTSATVSDTEGTNGVRFVSSSDPRTPVVSVTRTFPVTTWLVPVQATVSAPMYTLASGIEAQLIHAEAQLARNDVAGWLATLNSLRSSAITPAMTPLVDSGAVTLPPGKTATDMRLKELFDERAAWLFATAHRQGDLRRLIRNYYSEDPVTAQATFYPVGSYPGALGVYGTDVVAPLPQTEQVENPRSLGCFDYNA